MENISYKLDQFEGPLDLLLTLIAKNKIDINDIPISLLCEQYMEYITAEENRDIEISSEFLVMASELMLLKSRMLLPKQEDEEDPRASLVEAMLEYQRAKLAAAKMNLMYATYGLRLVKEQDEISVDKTYVADHESSLLAKALLRVLSESESVTNERARERFEPLVSAPQVPVIAVASSLFRMLKSGRVRLDGFFKNSGSRSMLIAKFMAVLEMLRSGIVVITSELFENEDGIVEADGPIEIEMAPGADEKRLSEIFAEELTEENENKDNSEEVAG